jgi:hypothetical protein
MNLGISLYYLSSISNKQEMHIFVCAYDISHIKRKGLVVVEGRWDREAQVNHLCTPLLSSLCLHFLSLFTIITPTEHCGFPYYKNFFFVNIIHNTY